MGPAASGGAGAQVAGGALVDLDMLAAQLRDLGVVVHRPAIVDHGRAFAAPGWSSSSGFSSYCPRDVALVLDDTIIEPPG
ncbi:hypothetical protein [Actinoplanes sp. G11-F43]|uniref:hypothetical protein n=1 Tax=Actinoplanes sp. G11-F43 TaxID=3424130 RepID=UPI003D33E7AE